MRGRVLAHYVAIFLLCPYMSEGSSSGLITSPIQEGFMLMTKSSPEGPPDTITLGVSISTYEFWENTVIQSTIARKEWTVPSVVGTWNSVTEQLTVQCLHSECQRKRKMGEEKRKSSWVVITAARERIEERKTRL